MGNCCSNLEVIDNSTNRSTSISRHSSILLEKISNLTDYRKKYEFISILGKGAFGRVRLYREKFCKMYRAIKTLKKNFLNKHSIKSIIREVGILRSLDHPNIVNYFETYEDELYLHIVMEYIPGENLINVITNKQYYVFTEKEMSQIIRCLLKGVLFLHHNNIIHRDIKPDNILFAVPGNYESLKLIDFGLSIQRNAEKENYRVGTPYYMAPEMIKGNCVFESDLWSIGVILFVMITGKQPFRAHNKEEVFEKITNAKYDRKVLHKAECSPELKDLIKKILVKETNKRLSVSAALDHPWFKKYDDDKNNANAISPEIIQSLKDFQHQNLLQKEILYYLAKILKEKEIEKLKEAFSIIDKDNSGEIEYEEIPKIFKELGIVASERELQAIFNSLDFHSDGKVNYSEFLAGTLSSIPFLTEENLYSAFKHFDTTDSGFITYESVVEALKKSNCIVDEEGLVKVFKQLQMNGKKINFNEFKKIVYGINN